ncbi:sensor histidine kinase [Brevibacterium daeguense]|uniref:histidine kinase n=1 Tax=Brevibacterium daeguense TaxID=909936 RepID=A0ABP8EML7_9MICO|nr:histidine kinase [Brevibacterium daeguense]
MESFTLATVAERFPPVLRAHPWLLDAVLAVLVVAIGAISSPGLSLETPLQVLYTGIVIGSAAALVVRRTRPRAALAAIGVLLLVHLVAGIELGICVATICAIVAYTTQTQLDPPGRRIFLAAVYAGTVIAIMTAPIATSGIGIRDRLVAAAVALAVLTLAVLTGVVRRQRRSRYDAAVERAAMLQAQQETQRRLAVIEERNRIAREMHDIIGHSLNAIAVQAEGVRHVLGSDVDRADQALADIGSLSRRAVDDVRDLIDVLAAEDADAPTRPAPTVRDIPELIDSLHYTHTAIRLRIDGEPDTVPEHLGLTVYRIVQEGLTNALKHAEGAPVTVTITIHAREVELMILNTAGRAAPAQGRSTGGHGIVGMQERARAHGGFLDAGPDPTTGGWRVSAKLPWARA